MEFKMPSTGMGITEATIVKWHKALGDSVKQDEILVEAETAKATVEIRSTVNGRIERIIIGEGSLAEVNAVIAVIAEASLEGTG